MATSSVLDSYPGPSPATDRVYGAVLIIAGTLCVRGADHNPVR
jgi:hypothetical protein